MDSPLVLDIPPGVAIASSLLISFLFVVSLYLWKLAGFQDKDRNNPDTIKRRFISTIATCICSAGIIFTLSRPAVGYERGLSFLQMIGVEDLWTTLRASSMCLCLTASLFLGPVVQHLIDVKEYGAPFCDTTLASWTVMRDLVVAPFTEEFVFRACLVRLWVAGSFPKVFIVVGSPICFALAHTHHFVEHVRRLEDKQAALMQVAFQVFYTSLFGMYTAFLLLRTGSVVAVVLAHTFCNHQGFPDVTVLVSDHHPLFHWRWCLAALYVVGIILFCSLIVPLTSGFDSSFGMQQHSAIANSSIIE